MLILNTMLVKKEFEHSGQYIIFQISYLGKE